MIHPIMLWEIQENHGQMIHGIVQICVEISLPYFLSEQMIIETIVVIQTNHIQRKDVIVIVK